VLGQDMSATKSAAGARSRGGILADAAFLSQLNDLSDLTRMSTEQLLHRLVLARRIGTTVLGQLAELKRPSAHRRQAGLFFKLPTCKVRIDRKANPRGRAGGLKPCMHIKDLPQVFEEARFEY